MQVKPPLDHSEFERLLDRLAKDIVDAAVFRHLLADLRASVPEFEREFSQSRTFWSLSFQAYYEIVLHRLSRVYVSHDQALTLGRWLEAIRSNPKLFTTPPDPAQLCEDMKLVGQEDPVVKKLIGLRMNIVVHINWGDIAGDSKLGDRFALTRVEIDELVSRAELILHRYSILFKQAAWSNRMVGRDDFRTLLKALRNDLNRMEGEIAEEIERATQAAASGPGNV